MKQFPCGSVHETIRDIRVCRLCQKNGTADGIAGNWSGLEPVEILEVKQVIKPVVVVKVRVAKRHIKAIVAVPMEVKKPVQKNKPAKKK